MIELYANDFVLLKDGEPMERVDIIYDQQTIDELFENGFKLHEGEEFVPMTDLPKALQALYIEYLTENKGERDDI